MVVGMSLPMSALAALAIVLSRFVTPDLFFKLSDSEVNPLYQPFGTRWHLSQSALGIGSNLALLFHVSHLNRLSTEF